MSTLHAVTVLGHDRPGIIAETTGRLAGLGLNLEDSTMTLLRGHFAMMLLCAGDTPAAEIESALAPLTDDGTLTVTVREVPQESGASARGSSWVLTVHYLVVAEIDLPAGADVDAVTAAIREAAAELGVGATLRPAEADEL